MSPNLVSVTLAAASPTSYNLDTLLQAVVPAGTYHPKTGFICQFVSIQSDPGNGGAKLWIGNNNVSSTNNGVVIFAAQTWPIYSVDANLINLSHISLMTDTPGIQLNISWLTR